MKDQKSLYQIAQRIQAIFHGTLAVYLFGSVAKGATHQESDIDLSVLATDQLPVMDVWMLAQKLAIEAGVDVDLVDLRAASTVMRMQIISEGERLLCVDDDTCQKFEDFVYADFARLNEERAAILADIQERGSVYG